METKLPFIGTSNSNLRVLLIILAVLVLGIGAVSLAQRAQESRQLQPAPAQPAVEAPLDASAQSLIYGVWQGEQTVLHAVNTDGSGDSVIGVLAKNIKNLHIISKDKVIYIADTNERDHGARIAVYNLSTNREQTVVTADNGWGIDSLIVSPDKNWIAYWQVQLGSSGALTGGASRVYSASLASTAKKYRIFDETALAGSVVHYPLFFDHSGNLYSDGFVPNSDGWNRGLMRTAATGGTPTQVLAVDSYSTDPVLSPNQNLIVYTSHDPAYGAPIAAFSTTGKQNVASLNPNVVNVLDLQSGAARRLIAESGRLYYDPTWRNTGDQVFVRSYGYDGQQLSDPRAMTLSLVTGASTLFDTAQQPDGIILAFGPDGLIVGAAIDPNLTGNLGSTYAPVLSAITVGSGSNVQAVAGNNSQFIGVMQGKVNTAVTMNPAYSGGTESLQLATFSFKPELENRLVQQNDTVVPTKDGRPQCKPLYKSIVSGQASLTQTSTLPEFGTGVSLDITTGRENTLQLGQFGPKVTITQQLASVPSYKQLKPLLQEQYKCYDSPLYLYPEQETEVSVRVNNASVLSSNLPYDAIDGWNVVAQPSGLKIEYTYASKFTAPQNGLVVKAKDLSQTLDLYARQLGLVGQEVEDYLDFWSQGLPASEYYLVSHYANPSAIMGFDISPKPDTFIQAVMYFKPLNKGDVGQYNDLNAPEFAPTPERNGFTAVDWSGIVDR